MMLPSLYIANSTHQGGTPRCRALSQLFVDLEHEAIPCVSSGDDSPLSANSELLSSRGFGALLLRRERRPLVEMGVRPRTVSSTGEVAAEQAASAPRGSEAMSNRRDGSEERDRSPHFIAVGGTGFQTLERLLSLYHRTGRAETATRPMPMLPPPEAANPDVLDSPPGLGQASLEVHPSRPQDLRGAELLDAWRDRRQPDCHFYFVGHGSVDAHRVAFGGQATPARDLEHRHTDSLGTTFTYSLRPRGLGDRPDDAQQNRTIFLLDICHHGALLTFPMTEDYQAPDRYGLVDTMTGLDLVLLDSCSTVAAAGAITDPSRAPLKLRGDRLRPLLVVAFDIAATAIVDRSLLSVRPDGGSVDGDWIVSVRLNSASHPCGAPRCLVVEAIQSRLWRSVPVHDQSCIPLGAASGEGAFVWSPWPFHSKSVTRKLPQHNDETAVRSVATDWADRTCVPSSAVVSRRHAPAEAVYGSCHDSWFRRWPVLERTNRLLRRLRDRLHLARRAPMPLWGLILHGRQPRPVDDPATELVTFINEILETRACRLAPLPSIDALSLRNLLREFLGEWLCGAPTDQQLFHLYQGAERASARWAIIRAQLVQERPHQQLVWTPREQAGFFLNRVLSYWAAARGSHSAGLVDLGGFVGTSRLAWRLVSGHRSLADILWERTGSWVPDSAPANLHSLSRRLAWKLGIEVWEHDLEDLEGCLVVSRRRSVIHVGSQLQPDRRAWVICHELAHGVLCGKIRLKDYRIRHLHRPNSSYGLDPELLRGKPRECDRFQRQEREAEALASLLVHHLDGLIEVWSADSRLSGPSALERAREGQRHSPLVVAERESSWNRWAAIPRYARDRVREDRNSRAQHDQP